MPPAKPPVLDYAPKPPLPQRRWFHRGLFILSLLFLAAAASLYAPQAWHRIQLLYWQRQCMNYRTNSEVVFNTSTNKGFSPRVWTKFYGLYYPSGDRAYGVAFLHARQSPSGNNRLVVVRIFLAGNGVIYFTSSIITPATMHEPRTNMATDRSLIMYWHGETEIFSGQPDLSDSSHFTIDYEMNGQRKTLDGYLRDDDTILLEDRRSK